MKKTPYIIISLIASIGFMGCDVNEQFEGLDEMIQPTNIAHYQYTLSSSDYNTIGTSALEVATNAVDSAKALIIKTNKYFLDTIPVGDYASSLLGTKYKYADEGSDITLTYDFFEKYDTTSIASANKYTLEEDDYTAMGTGSGQPGQFGNFSASIDPNFFIPIWLKLKYPYAQLENVKLIRYQYYISGSVTQRVSVFVFDGSSWVPISEVTSQEAKFKMRAGIWTFVDTDILVGLNANTQIGSNLGDFIPISIEGDAVWSWDSYNYMKITGYLSGPIYNTNEDWLVSPAFNLSERTDSIFFTFDHVARYFNDPSGSIANMKKSISVWISTTSDGSSINPSEWTELILDDLDYPSGANWNFVPCSIELIDYLGQSNIRIAFKYNSSNEDGYAGTWEVKNVYVYEKQN